MSADRTPVAIDVTPLLGVRTGIGVAVAEIIGALGALGVDGPDITPFALSVRARLHREALPAHTHFVPIPARGLLWSWKRFDRPRIDKHLGHARVLHATNYLTPPSRLPTVVSVYDCSFVRYPELCTPEVRAFEPILRRAVARGVTIHTSSEFSASEIDEVFGPGLREAGRLVVIRLGVPPLGARSEMPAEVETRLHNSPYVLAIGTIEPRKDHARLVRAFGAIATDHSDVRLVIAGPDGAARPGVDAAVAALPAHARDRVLFAGPVSDAGRRALLERATVLAYPSIYEGFGFPVLEAMAAGVAVVATRVSSLPEIAGDAALLIDPNDDDALATALSHVLLDENKRRELVSRGLDRVTAFSWDGAAREFVSLYGMLAS